MRKKQYSYSQLRLFNTCPLAYKLAYIDKKKSLPSEAMNRGSDLHQWIAGIVEKREMVGDNPRLSSFLSRLYRCDEIVVEESGFDSLFKIDFIEFDFVGKVDVYGISGKKAIIIDWKTGRSQGEIEQLKGYALYISEKFPETEIFETYFYYLDQNYYSREVFTRDEVEEYRIELEEKLWGLHETEEYKAKVGGLCNFCGHARECYEARKYQLEPITSQDDFVGLWEKVSLAEAFVKQAKDLLKKYMEINGVDLVVNGAEKIYLSTYTTMKTGKLKKDELIDLILTEQGGDKKQLSKMKVAELVERLKNRPVLEEKEATDIKPLPEPEKADTSENKPAGKVIPVQDVSSKTLKADLIATILDWCNQRGVEEEREKLEKMKRTELYQYFKALVGYRPEPEEGKEEPMPQQEQEQAVELEKPPLEPEDGDAIMLGHIYRKAMEVGAVKNKEGFKKWIKATARKYQRSPAALTQEQRKEIMENLEKGKVVPF